MSGDVGKILEVAAVAAAAYFTAGGSLAAEGAGAGAAGGMAGAGEAAAAGYGSAAELGAAEAAGAGADAGMIGAASGGLGAAGTIGAAGVLGAGALNAGGDYGLMGAAGDAAGDLSGMALTGSTLGAPTAGGYTVPNALVGSAATEPAVATSPLTSTLDWLSKNKNLALGAGKLMGGLYMMGGLAPQNRAIMGQMQQNIGNLQPIPASQANLTDAQLQAIQRSMAAQGYIGSGNMMSAIAKGALGQQLQVEGYNNSVAAQKQALLAQELQSSNTSAAATLSGMGLLGGGIATLAGWK